MFPCPELGATMIGKGIFEPKSSISVLMGAALVTPLATSSTQS